MGALLYRGGVAGKTNVAERMLIEGQSDCLPVTTATPPTPDGRLSRQDGVHDHAEEVILSQEAGVGFAEGLGGPRQIPIWA
jgi:hypothetical protein